MTRVASDWHRAKPHLSSERLAEYRRLLDRIGCPRGVVSMHEGRYLEVINSSAGLITGGYAKGYAWIEEQPHWGVKVVDNLRHTGGWDEAYRRVTGNWYLVFHSY